MYDSDLNDFITEGDVIIYRQSTSSTWRVLEIFPCNRLEGSFLECAECVIKHRATIEKTTSGNVTEGCLYRNSLAKIEHASNAVINSVWVI